MKIHKITFKDSIPNEYEIDVRALNLHATSNSKANELNRKFKLNKEYFSSINEIDQKYFNGYELLKERRYESARKIFENNLDKDTNHHASRMALSDLMFRSSQYDKGLRLIEPVLQLNTYDPNANFIAGNHYRALNMNLNAKESLSLIHI